MARKAFYSFYYTQDSWRASMVRNMGVIEGNSTVSDNDWEAVKRGGDPAIQRWIDGQLHGKSCTIVLIGHQTAGRKWINYEIKKSWNMGKGIVGIHIHNLLDQSQSQSAKGQNPFTPYTINGVNLSNIVKSYDPPFVNSQQVYNYINANLLGWVEEAITIRSRY